MADRMGRHIATCTIAVAFALVVSERTGRADEPAERARQVLEAAGVRGGLIVQLGCGDGRLTAALGRSGRFVVRGLDRDERAVGRARGHILAEGLYGRTSVALREGEGLPFRDNLVNLIVAPGALGVGEEECLRVLAPHGVLLVRKGGGWQKRVKPRPDEIDEWTHFLHGPDNNAVARDRVVGPPAGLQWLADPIHLRSHEHLNGVSAVVSAGGRIFTIIDEGATSAVAAAPKWRLVARDAFNGLLLWKRELGPWEGHFRLFRSGPPEIARRLVATGERAYATLGYGKPVAAFDAATGRTVRTYDHTAGAVEIVCDAGRLFVVVGTIPAGPRPEPARPFRATPAPRRKGIVAVDAASGRLLWQRKDEDTAALMPTTLAVSGGRVFFQNTRQVLCLDAASGEPKWRADRPVYTTRLSWSAPTLVAHGGVVLSADGSTGGLPGEAGRGSDAVRWIMSARDVRKHPGGDLVAFDARSGKRLWAGKSLQGFCNPGDVFVIGDTAWAGANVATRQVGLDAAVDVRTGEVRTRRPDNGLPVGGHTRCYRNKATERFLLLGGVGVEFVDVRDWSWKAHHWVRGSCQYGVMPCNGLLYSPPDSCACRPEARLHGFAAMAPASADDPATEGDPPAQLRKGPAYAAVQGRAKAPAKADPRAWPTYRCDPARSGRTAAAVPARLRQAWRREIGGKLTPLTVGEGKVFVSRVDAHRVIALDAGSGRPAWRRTVGGPVDSPPTIHRDLVIFGCRDGAVYCLRARDGELVWRFRAARRQRMLTAMESVESAWPVHGSVLVRDGLVWFVAGRSPYLDGGLRLYALDAASGRPAVTRRLNSRGVESFRTSRPKAAAVPDGHAPPMLPDILSASGELIYMRWMGLDADGRISRAVKPHLFSATGYLDDTWWHRTYWQWGTWMRGGFGGWPQAARQRPAGRLMAVSDDALFGYGRTKYDPGNPKNVHAGHVGVVKDGYQDSGRIDPTRNPHRLFSAKKPGGAAGGVGRRRGGPAGKHNWRVPVPMLVRAMVLADRTLLVAGPPAGQDNRGLIELGAAGPGLLWAVSAADGAKLAARELPSAPVFDGMAAVPGRVLLSCLDGSVICLGQ